MYSRTALVTNNPFEPFQADSKLPFFYRECNCDTNLTSNTPANQYQRQKNGRYLPPRAWQNHMGPLRNGS